VSTWDAWKGARLRGALRSQAGATAVEYGIMVALVAAVIVGAVLMLGERTGEGYDVATRGLTGDATSPDHGSDEAEERCKDGRWMIGDYANQGACVADAARRAP
jgi:pilus assembly protein Flp/PilA